MPLDQAARYGYNFNAYKRGLRVYLTKKHIPKPHNLGLFWQGIDQQHVWTHAFIFVDNGQNLDLLF
jgi:hypothetical protein